MTHKILIVGHPSSDLDVVEALLTASGMAPAQPSRREGLSPAQIDATLLRAHGGSGTAQVRVGPVWQGLALDLLMGNLEQPVWGWQDPAALPLLDFWCSVDPELRVVLAYDRPESVLTRLSAAQAQAITPEDLARYLDDWAAYQEAVLHFAYRHRGRCLLVHARQVSESPEAILSLLRGIAPAAWSLPETTSAGAAAHRPFDNPLTAWLARTPLADSPRALAMYDELQVVADLPEAPAPERRPVEHWLPVWSTWTVCSQALQQQQDDLARSAGELATLAARTRSREHALEAELASLRDEHRQACDSAAAALSTQHERADQDAAALLTQLHRVQESYEALHLERQRDRTAHSQTLAQCHQAEALSKASAAELEALRRRLQAAEKTATDLRQQTQAQQGQIKTLTQDVARLSTERQAHAAREASQRTQLEAAVRQAHQENALLLAQLHRVQESLEQLHVERAAKPAAPRKPVPYGAADRIKQQLSYRLGATMIEQSTSIGGWLAMPWALKRTHQAYREELVARGNKKLPPLHTYGDAQDAERVRQHLSYRLGHALISHGQTPTGWLTLPLALGREVKAFRREREQVAA
jgi:hypothetical protein